MDQPVMRRVIHTNGVVAVLVAATNGTWMRSSSRFAAKSTIYGEPWIRTATCSTSWCRVDATKKLPNASFASFSKDCTTFLA